MAQSQVSKAKSKTGHASWGGAALARRRSAIVLAAKLADAEKLARMVPKLRRSRLQERFERGSNLLMLAAAAQVQEDSAEKCVNILAGKINALCVNDEGDTALHVAASAGSVGAVRALCSLVPELATIENSDGQTPLSLAAGCGSADCVEVLLPYSNPNQTDAYGNTPLHVAAWRGHSGAARLLSAMCDLFAKDNGGDSALDCAAIQGHEDLAMDLAVLAAGKSRVSHRVRRSALVGAGKKARKKKHVFLAGRLEALGWALFEIKTLSRSVSMGHSSKVWRSKRL